MKGYKHILLAADFTGHGDYVAAKAAELARLYQAKLSVCHAVDSLPISESVYGPIIPFEGNLTTELVTFAEKELAGLGENFGIPVERQWVVIGSPRTEILYLAQEHEADLIVVGSHARHGLGLLLGSTANSVLHHAKCDVLAVRLLEAD